MACSDPPLPVAPKPVDHFQITTFTFRTLVTLELCCVLGILHPSCHLRPTPGLPSFVQDIFPQLRVVKNPIGESALMSELDPLKSSLATA